MQEILYLRTLAITQISVDSQGWLTESRCRPEYCKIDKHACPSHTLTQGMSLTLGHLVERASRV
jgi:hypothetical protein